MGGYGCFSVHASDLAPALIALDAQVTLAGPSGERTLPLNQFFAGPEREVQSENVLASNEVLTEVIVPKPPEEWRGTYLKARERTAGDFPLVSVAVGYALQEGAIQQARVVLGGIAPVPWVSAAAVTVLEGQPLSADLAARAAEAALPRHSPCRTMCLKLKLATP